jgi:hypothetical protein
MRDEHPRHVRLHFSAGRSWRIPVGQDHGSIHSAHRGTQSGRQTSSSQIS